MATVFVKRTRVKRGDREYVYLQMVEGYRDETGKVRHRVVAKLGREDELKASGQLDALAGSFARLDPPLAGVRRDVGALLLASHLLSELEVRATVDRMLPRSPRSELSLGELVEVLVANRLCSPSPLYDVAGWASGAAVSELFGTPAQLLDDDRLGRGLESFAPRAEAVRGALAARAIERFGVEAGRLHVDLTAVRVAGAYEGSALVRPGWAQGEGVGRQVRALQASSAEGVPLYLRPEAGDAAELSLIGAALERLRALAESDGGGPALLVCDSAMGHPRSLVQIARAGLSFIVPLRVASGFRERYLTEVGPEAMRPLDYVAERERRLPRTLRTRYRGALRDWEMDDPKTGERHRFRIAYIHSSEEEREVREARERALQRAEEGLGRIRNGLGGRHYKTREQVDRRVAQILTDQVADLIEVETGTRDGKPTISWLRDEEAIAEASRADGVYALATNLADRRLGANAILHRYKGQQIAERRHRDLKQTLRVRPIFLHNDDRIHALVSIIGIALLVFGLIESELRKRLAEATDGEELMPGLLPEGRAAKPTGRNVLGAFQGLGLTYTRDGIVLDRLTATQRRTLELLEIQVPWPQQQR